MPKPNRPELLLKEDLEQPRGFLIEQLTAYLGRKVEPQEFIRGDYGKLQLKDQDLHFNYSHSGRWTIFVFAEEPIGIDLEQVNPRPSARKIIQRFFPPECLHQFDSLKDHQAQLDFFYKLWTFYESAIKFYGGSAFHFGHAQKLKTITSRSTELQTPEFYIQKIELNLPGLACAATSAKPLNLTWAQSSKTIP